MIGYFAFLAGSLKKEHNKLVKVSIRSSTYKLGKLENGLVKGLLTKPWLGFRTTARNSRV